MYWYTYIAEYNIIIITDGTLILCITPKPTHYNVLFYLNKNITTHAVKKTIDSPHHHVANILTRSIIKSETLNNDYIRIVELVRTSLGFYFTIKLNGCLEDISTIGHCL